MLRPLAWIELFASIFLLALVVWPVSGFCSGRVLGLDCEAWFIFGVNLFGPLGLLALGGAVWSLKYNSWLSQCALLLGVLVVVGYLVLHLYILR